MPCNCDHMEPTQHELESSKLMVLLVEAGLHKGDIPYYGEVSAIHEHTAMLCKFCQDTDVTAHSLELQIWWRDHQEADKKKLKRQQQEAKTEDEQQAALEKLSDHERKLLGL